LQELRILRWQGSRQDGRSCEIISSTQYIRPFRKGRPFEFFALTNLLIGQCFTPAEDFVLSSEFHPAGSERVLRTALAYGCAVFRILVLPCAALAQYFGAAHFECSLLHPSGFERVLRTALRFACAVFRNCGTLRVVLIPSVASRPTHCPALCLRSVSELRNPSGCPHSFSRFATYALHRLLYYLEKHKRRV